MFEPKSTAWKTGATVFAVTLGMATAGAASTVTGAVTFSIADGAFTTGVFDSDTGGAATSASTNIGYTVNLTGTGVLTNTLSSTTTVVPQGWVASGTTTVTGSWSNPPAALAQIGISGPDDSVTVSRSLTVPLAFPASFEQLGNLPVAPGGTVTVNTALGLLLGFDPTGSFTFGGGQGILTAGDTISGSIDFVSGVFDLTVTGNDALLSLQTYTGFLTSLGIAPSTTLTAAFGDPDDWDRSVLAFLPDSGTFTTTGTIQPIPVPAALPLLAGGLGLLGFMGWRRKRAEG